MRSKVALWTLFAALVFWCVGQANAQQSQPSSGTQGNQPYTAQTVGQGPEGHIWIVAGPIPENVTSNSARIWWQTNSPSSTILRYGTDANNLSQHKEVAWGQASHQIDLTGLQPDTTYYFEIDTSGQRAITRQTFKTESAQQAQSQFQITHGPVIEQLTPNSAVIAWTTNAPASSVVMYGSDPNNLNQKAEAAWGQTTHRVTVNGLQPNTHYWFEVQSGQAQGTGQMAQSNPFPATTVASGQSAMNFNTK